jgi:cell division control protein 24
MKLWETNITRLIKEVAARRASRANSRVALTAASHPAVPRLASAYDRAWSTTESVYSNGQHNGRHRSSPPGSSDEHLEPSTANGNGNGNGPAGYPGYEGFDVDDDDLEDYPTASSTYGSSGRGTPVGARRGTAPNIAIEHDSFPSYERPRARTEDINGHVISQWRTNALPPTPGTATLRTSTPATAALPPGASRPTAPHALTATGHPSDVNSRTGRSGVRAQVSATKLKAAYENGETRSKVANGLPSQNRSRSASQPNTYLPSKPPAPPLPNPTPWAHQANAPSGSVKRGSGSSQSTGESSDYSPNGSSPITPFGSSESSLGAVRPPRSQPYENPVPFTPPVKVKVHFHEDIFVIQVPRSTEYNELVERVGRKIRLCGPRRDDGPLRVKYRDEDGDMVSLGSTEDVQMAFEQYRPGGQVTLYVT